MTAEMAPPSVLVWVTWNGTNNKLHAVHPNQSAALDASRNNWRLYVAQLPEGLYAPGEELLDSDVIRYCI